MPERSQMFSGTLDLVLLKSETVVQDVRYGLRLLHRSPGLTAVAALSLGLGIGANSTIFSWVHATLLNPIPAVPHASEYVEPARGVPVPATSICSTGTSVFPRSSPPIPMPCTSNVFGLFLAQGARLVVVEIAIGLSASFASTGA